MSDTTFRIYTAEQARAYGSARTSTGGTKTMLLDVGCGPGNATRDVAVHFDMALGTDPGEQMINTARELGGKTANGDITFAMASAEDNLEGRVSPGSLSLITAAMAAHWFDMPKFWNTAAQLLAPGGTVALWTRASFYCHPNTPNATEVQRILFHLERELLAPYELPGNRLSRDMYDNLPLPWEVSDSLKAAFPPAQFVRREWDREGVLSATGPSADFFGGGEYYALDDLEKGWATASMVTRWREANAALVGTAEDCVAVTVRQLREALGETKGFVGGQGTAILLLKRA